MQKNIVVVSSITQEFLHVPGFYFTYSIAFPYYEDKSNEKQNIRFQYYPLKVPLELGYTNHCFSVCSRQLFSITLYATMTILINHSTKQLTELKLTLILQVIMV